MLDVRRLRSIICILRACVVATRLMGFIPANSLLGKECRRADGDLVRLHSSQDAAARDGAKVLDTWATKRIATFQPVFISRLTPAVRRSERTFRCSSGTSFFRRRDHCFGK